MNLIGGYLLVLLVLFTANIALIVGNYKINNIKLILLSTIFFITCFSLMCISEFINTSLAFLWDNFMYVFLLFAVILFASLIYYSKTENVKLLLFDVLFLFLIFLILFASQSSLNQSTIIIYSLMSFIVFMVVYQLTKLLHHAKRQYPVIIGEYMSLFSLLLFIFTLTYNSTKNLDYTMFNSFLILTPTYQLIYVIIGIVVVLVIGVVINDFKGGNS